MKSKKSRLILAALLIAAIGTWAWWQLKPKPKETYTNKEISIKQAEIPEVDTVTYRDWAGFQFDYPSILAVKEIELDNAEVYSSLELSGTDNKTLTVRVSDTQIAGLTDWQKIFNEQHSLRKINSTALAGMDALELLYGAPEMKLTVAIENGIIYQIESLADGGFWDRTHQELVTSWKFNLSSAPPAAAAENSSSSDAIVLIEETVE